MATGSETFKWNLFGSAPHRCWKCGKEPLLVKDVAEHRRRYPGAIDEFLCQDCNRERVEKAVRENRRALGLKRRLADSIERNRDILDKLAE